MVTCKWLLLNEDYPRKLIWFLFINSCDKANKSFIDTPAGVYLLDIRKVKCRKRDFLNITQLLNDNTEIRILSVSDVSSI